MRRFLPDLRGRAFFVFISASLVAVLLPATALSGGSDQLRPAASASAASAFCSGRGSVLSYGNWECGTPKQRSPWGGLASVADYSFQRVTDNVRQGRYAGRFEVRPGDDPSGRGTSERSEVYWLPDAARTEGSSAYYAFSVRFGAKWRQPRRGCCIFAQWRAKTWSTGWPPLMMVTPKGPSGEIQDRVAVLQRSGICTLPPDQRCSNEVNHTLLSGAEFRQTRGKWHDWIVYVKWSAVAGHVKIWHRLQGRSGFKVLLDKNLTSTLKASNGEIATVYPKFGLYRPYPPPFTHVLFNDSYCVARLYSGARGCLP